MSRAKSKQSHAEKGKPEGLAWADKNVDVESIGDGTYLTDDECDFIIHRVLNALRDQTNPIDFFRGMGRGVVFEVSEKDRERVRGLVRLFARAG